MRRNAGATILGMLALAMLVLTGCDAMPGRPQPDGSFPLLACGGGILGPLSL
jgi:hypothetical protein